ncbi:glycosyltransferase [Flavitalea sp. BT771]|uniref:glycosyltransferase family 2 protein n=1 Tax=Flavitalea sp. BT771 TaxID=3063329 RepID=UPI0026E1C97E|nr:glycosyltransferase [Flavitalea sp. BT771]MDO6430696.1 glycosyltransferase [Flavitalea sp. BT771]MDV6219164.1 glycosyltransferase [Flavitalea sp. BT771]
MDPKVTILMPACNAGKYIADAIWSVLEQTYADFELLIVDDGSVDDTVKVVRQFGDRRIRLLSKEKEGISAALNAGLQIARGKYIARFDADDICLPQRLERQVLFLDGHPAYLVIGSDAEYISENGEHLFHFRCAGHTHREIIGNLYRNCPFIHSAVMYRKDPIVRMGGYSRYAHNFEDYLLWVQLLKTGKCCNLPEPLMKVRINPSSVTIDEKWRGRRFRQLKQTILQRGIITREEGDELWSIIQRQDNRKIKEGAYHALCGKKLLADNYRPARARWHVTKAIHANPFRFDNYVLLSVSFLPRGWIKWLHRISPGKI